MDAKHTMFSIYISMFVRYMLIVLSICLMPSAYAENDKGACELSYIQTEFPGNANTINNIKIETIQIQLKGSGYGATGKIGKIGPKVHHALQRLCQDFNVKASEQFTNDLIDLLQMSFTVSQKHPKWRKIIRSESFKSWLICKSKQEQETIKTTLQSGPADRIIAILNSYDSVKQAGLICQPAVERGPMYFYRWSADDPPSTCNTCPDKVQKALSEIEGKTYPNPFLFLQALIDTGADPVKKSMSSQSEILQQARHGPVKIPEKLQIRGDGCGCSRDFSSLVVGFFPFWQVTEEVQFVDFSLFDRININVFSLDVNAEIQYYPKWNNEHIETFIKNANRYRVKVDSTINVSNWQKWSEQEITKAANAIAEYAVVNISNVELSSREDRKEGDDRKNHAEHMDNNSSIHIKDKSSKTASGITLHFERNNLPYSGKIITKLVNQLELRLTRKKPWLKKILGMNNDKGYNLNIMLSIDINEHKNSVNERLFKELKNILLDERNGQLINNVYLYLQEPTKYTKKNLRQRIEKSFRGKNRKTVLRKIVPIILLPTNYNEVYVKPIGAEKDISQFEDDLIYFQDNFAGVGLWPLPLIAEKSEKAEKTILEEKLTSIFKVTDSSNDLGDMINEHASWLCKFACPNRWAFRIVFDLLAGIILLYALLAMWICKLRLLYKKYSWIFLAVSIVTVLILLTSLVCDPFWSAMANTVVISIILLVFVATIWRYVIKAIRPPLP